MGRSVVAAITGVGVDAADIADFEHLPYDRYTSFYQRCFTEAEIAYCRARPRPAQHFAARFAAKEATIKALSGRFQPGYWQIEVQRTDSGKPMLHIWNTGATGPAPELDGCEFLVSMSHTDTLAIALVVANESITKE